MAKRQALALKEIQDDVRSCLRYCEYKFEPNRIDSASQIQESPCDNQQCGKCGDLVVQSDSVVTAKCDFSTLHFECAEEEFLEEVDWNQVTNFVKCKTCDFPICKAHFENPKNTLSGI